MNCTPASCTTWEGDYFRVDSAGSGTLPDGGVPIGYRGVRREVGHRFAPLADHLVAVEPEAELIKAWDKEKGHKKSRKIGQIPICWDPDRDTAVERAHDQFRWFAGGWAVNADLPTTGGVRRASQFVRPADIADTIPCGPDLDAIAEAVKPYVAAGFTDLAVVQVGDQGQSEFLEQAAGPLLEKLRALG